MNWDNFTKQYESHRRKTADNPRLEKSWAGLMRSTDRLVWLFLLSGSGKKNLVKAG